MVPADAMPALIHPADLALAFEQAQSLHAGPGFALLVIGLVVAAIALVCALSAFESPVAEADAASALDPFTSAPQLPLLSACAADELATLTMLKAAMLDHVERGGVAR